MRWQLEDNVYVSGGKKRECIALQHLNLEVIKRQRNHTTLAKQLLYMNTSEGVSALVWGEVDAISAYSTSPGPNFKVRDAGVYIDACGFLGASPDGIVEDDSGLTLQLVEVKCPYKGRSKVMQEMYSDSSFCCSLVDGHPTLTQEHDYYFQVQGQMAITGIHTCDFVVWTPIDILVLTISFDQHFCNTRCYPAILSVAQNSVFKIS